MMRRSKEPSGSAFPSSSNRMPRGSNLQSSFTLKTVKSWVNCSLRQQIGVQDCSAKSPVRSYRASDTCGTSRPLCTVLTLFSHRNLKLRERSDKISEPNLTRCRLVRTKQRNSGTACCTRLLTLSSPLP